MAAKQTSPEIDEIRVIAYLNGKYHSDREHFLDSWHRRIMFLVIVLGAGTVSGQFGSNGQIAIGIATTVFASLDLVIGFSVRARDHGFLREQYFEIAAEVEGGRLREKSAKSKMLKLAGKESPIFCAVHAIAENWAVSAVHVDATPPCELRWWQKFLRNYLRFDGSNFSCKSSTF